MKNMLRAALFLLLSVGAAFAQSSPNLITGQVPTAVQWNSYFAAKQDTLGYQPVNKAGDVMSGKLITSASTTARAGISILPGVAPTSPTNGDLWTTTTGVFARINGATVGPLAGTVGPITFTGQITTQDLTTTSPGWYAKITGDSFARVRVGLNSSDVSSIAFGPGNLARDTFLERVSAGLIRHGTSDSATPVAQTISVQNVSAGTSDTAGANLTIAGSQGTGTGTGGSILLRVAPAGSTGSSQNALSTAMTIDSTLRVTHAGTTTLSAALTYGGVALSNSVTGTGSMVLSAAPVITGHPTIEGVTSTGATGTGKFVFDTTPTISGLLVNTINGLAITTTTGTLTMATGRTLTVSNTLTFTGNDGTSFAFPSTSGIVISGTATQTMSNKTLTSPTINGASVSGTISGSVTVSGNNTYSGNLLFTGGVPSLANGNASVAASSTKGGLFTGKGSVSDVTIQNGAGNDVCSIATGGTTINCATLTLTNRLGPTNMAIGTAAALGIVQCDGTTITCSAGVITAVAPAAASISVGTTLVSSGTTANILYNNAGTLGNATIASFLTSGTGITVSGTTNATVGLAAIASGNMLANVSGGSAVPTATAIPVLHQTYYQTAGTTTFTTPAATLSTTVFKVTCTGGGAGGAVASNSNVTGVGGGAGGTGIKFFSGMAASTGFTVIAGAAGTAPSGAGGNSSFSGPGISTMTAAGAGGQGGGVAATGADASFLGGDGGQLNSSSTTSWVPGGQGGASYWGGGGFAGAVANNGSSLTNASAGRAPGSGGGGGSGNTSGTLATPAAGAPGMCAVEWTL